MVTGTHHPGPRPFSARLPSHVTCAALLPVKQRAFFAYCDAPAALPPTPRRHYNSGTVTGGKRENHRRPIQRRLSPAHRRTRPGTRSHCLASAPRRCAGCTARWCARAVSTSARCACSAPASWAPMPPAWGTRHCTSGWPTPCGPRTCCCRPTARPARCWCAACRWSNCCATGAATSAAATLPGRGGTFPTACRSPPSARTPPGVASAMRLRREKRVAVCCLGDGASSKGDFYEALNLAGVWRLPLVFVVSNNQWAISVPLSKQTACATLAQKAIAGGVPGVQVDGNDVLAVRQVMGRALARARRGDGPTLIEALTYRLGDHTTSDDARRYRPEAEVSAAWKRDPLPRLRQYMAGQGLWSTADEEGLIADCDAQVERAVAAYLATPPPPPTDMFDHLYAQLPPSLAGQRAEAGRGRPWLSIHAGRGGQSGAGPGAGGRPDGRRAGRGRGRQRRRVSRHRRPAGALWRARHRHAAGREPDRRRGRRHGRARACGRWRKSSSRASSTRPSTSW